MPDPAATLVDFVVAGAGLRQELARFEDDQAFMVRGGKVFYAIDTNIVWQFLNPGALGPRYGKFGGYAEVFPEDEAKASAALAAALSRYTFYRLNQFLTDREEVRLPLLLLEGHDAEVGSIYDRIIENFDRREADSRTKLGHLRDLLNDVVHAGDVVAQAEEVRASARQIIDLLYLDESPPALAKRLSQLFTDARLARLYAAAEAITRTIPQSDQKAVRNAAAGPRDLVSDVAGRQRRREWQARLQAVKNDERMLNLRVDARALAQLESINRELASSDLRVCLITGDLGLLAAGRSYTLEDGKTFSDSYLRHPRAFLAAHEVLVPARKEGKTQNINLGLISNWLDTLLARFSDDQAPSPEKLTDLIERRSDTDLLARSRKLLALDPNAISKLRDQWAAHTDAIRTEHAAPSKLAQEEIARVLGSNNVVDLREALDRIETELGAVSDATWDSYYRAVVRAGYDLVLADKPGAAVRRARNAPAIRFDDVDEASRFAREIISARGLRKFQPGEIDERLRAIEQQGGGYAVLLAYAVLFADAGRWHVALLTARRAVTVAELYRSSPAFRTGPQAVADEVRNRISGREAYYFAAVAQRMSARTIDDLMEAGLYLAKANAAFEEDKARKGRRDEIDLRLEAEELAQSVSRRMFGRYDDKTTASGEDRPTETDEAADTALMRWAFNLSERARQLDDAWTQRLVERGALVNFFSLTAMLEGIAPEFDHQKTAEAAGRLLELMKNDERAPKEELPVTDLVAMVGLYAEIRFMDPTRRRRSAIHAEIIKFEQDVDGRSRTFIMPYDAGRYRALVALIQRFLPERF